MSDSSGTEAGRRQRRRLDPDVRIRQILDAAFEVFSQKGFVATRIDDIALHAGMSKGGIYNHFSSKQAIFEAVVRGRGVHFNQSGISAGQVPVTVESVIQEVIEPVYNIFACDADIRLLRTIMIDGSTHAGFNSYWDQLSSRPFMEKFSAFVSLGVKQGNLRASPLTHTPALIITPALGYLFDRMMGTEKAPEEVQAYKAAHLQLLREQLTPDVSKDDTHNA